MHTETGQGQDCFYWTRLSPPESVTGNMFAVFYKDPDRPEEDGECVIIDAGIFLEGTVPGFKLPDISYISSLRRGNALGKYKVVGMIISHGHDDHLAALPYVINGLGMPHVYGFPFTIELCRLLENYDEYKSRLRIVKRTDNAIKLGQYFKAFLIYVTHSIPDSSHIALVIADKFVYYHGADFKLDPYPVDNQLTDMKKLSRFAGKRVNLLAVECVRGTEPAFTLSETELFPAIQKEMKAVEGNIFVTTFSSHIHRMQQIVNAAVDEGRKIVFVGRSVKGKSDLAMEMELLEIPKGHLLNTKQIEAYRYRDSNLCVITAGCQGQPDSAMLRLMNGGISNLRIKEGDKVIISASCIPGNNMVYYAVVRELEQRGIAVVYPTVNTTVHTSGHASSGDLKRFYGFFKDVDNVMPISGNAEHYHAFVKDIVGKNGHSLAKGNLLLPRPGEVLAVSKYGVTVADRFDIDMIQINQ